MTVVQNLVALAEQGIEENANGQMARRPDTFDHPLHDLDKSSSIVHENRHKFLPAQFLALDTPMDDAKSLDQIFINMVSSAERYSDPKTVSQNVNRSKFMKTRSRRDSDSLELERRRRKSVRGGNRRFSLGLLGRFFRNLF